jgi:hypothetical protein
MMAEPLNEACDVHGHDPGLPDRALRGHVLRLAMEAAERVLASHGYAAPERALETLHVALNDLLEEEARGDELN